MPLYLEHESITATEPSMETKCWPLKKVLTQRETTTGTRDQKSMGMIPPIVMFRPASKPVQIETLRAEVDPR